MRRLRYVVAQSLDGYIAGPNGEADWIIMDPDIDFTALLNQFDTVFVGRRTYEGMGAAGPAMPGMKTFVFSRTLRRQDHPKVTIVDDEPVSLLEDLRKKPGKDIWLFGGGSLFRSLSEIGLVDTVEVAVVPVLLGAGVPLLGSPAERVKLALTAHKIYESGVVSLEYAIVR